MTPRARTVTRALVGGAMGSFAMDVAQYAWAQALERNRPSGDQDEETEAISSVVAYLKRLVPGARAADERVLGRAIHYVFGVGFAAAYYTMVPGTRPSRTRAASFGMLLWLLSDRILIPVFKLGRPWSRYSVTERSNALVSHLAYAFVVETSRAIR